MFRATIRARALLFILDAIAAVATEARAHFTSKGMEVCVVDGANVAMVLIEASSRAFIKFECKEDEEIGLDIELMRRVVTRISESSQFGPVAAVEITTSPKIIQISSGNWVFNVHALMLESIRKDPSHPTINLPAVATLYGEVLADAITSAGMVSDKAIFAVEHTKDGEAKFSIATPGDDGHAAFHADFQRGHGERFDAHYISMEDGRASFSLDYLKDMAKVLNRSSLVGIMLGDDHPIKFQFESLNGEEIKGVYLLAPRVEEAD